MTGNAISRLLATFALVLAVLTLGCANLSAVPTFRGQLAYADALAGAVGRTCADLSARDRISIDTLIRCRSVVAESGTLIDAARAAGEGTGADRLAAAQRLLLELERDLRAREGAQ